MLSDESHVVVSEDLDSIVFWLDLEHSDSAWIQIICWNDDSILQLGNLTCVSIVLVDCELERASVAPGDRRTYTVDLKSTLWAWSYRSLFVASFKAHSDGAIIIDNFINSINDIARNGGEHFTTRDYSVVKA